MHDERLRGLVQDVGQPLRVVCQVEHPLGRNESGDHLPRGGQEAGRPVLPHHVDHVGEGEVGVHRHDDHGEGEEDENHPSEGAFDVLDNLEVELLTFTEAAQVLVFPSGLLEGGDAVPDLAGEAVDNADKDQLGDADEGIGVDAEERDEDEGEDDVDAGEVSPKSEGSAGQDEKVANEAGGEEDEVVDEGTAEAERAAAVEGSGPGQLVQEAVVVQDAPVVHDDHDDNVGHIHGPVDSSDGEVWEVGCPCPDSSESYTGRTFRENSPSIEMLATSFWWSTL